MSFAEMKSKYSDAMSILMILAPATFLRVGEEKAKKEVDTIEDENQRMFAGLGLASARQLAHKRKDDTSVNESMLHAMEWYENHSQEDWMKRIRELRHGTKTTARIMILAGLIFSWNYLADLGFIVADEKAAEA